MKGKLQTQPYKGARDFYPEDMRIRNYIFDVWKKVCERYGYEEYDGPFLESFDIYAAKTGEEIVNEQLYIIEDKAGRKLAIRPEMTPTVARMVAQKYKELPRPIRWFSVPNLWRYEKPQRGRLREHFQLNVDIFGVDSVMADFEIVSLAIDIMREFGADETMFEIRVGNRRLIEDVYTDLGIKGGDKRTRVSKAIDKITKISKEKFIDLLTKDAKLTAVQIDSLLQFIQNPYPTIEKLSGQSKGAQEVKSLLDAAKVSDYDKYLKYDPTVMRGFDYYTGNVFEQFDLNPKNTRSMYGGGRYDDLVEVFIGEKIPGVGFGMGDVTLKIFLESWDLLPKLQEKTDYLVTLWPNDPEGKYLKKTLEVASLLRKKGKNTQIWLEPNTKLDKQLKYADRKRVKNVVIIGEKELKNNSVTIKDMQTQTQETKKVKP